MNVWIGKATLLLAIAAIVAIRALHGRKRSKIKVVKTRSWRWRGSEV